MEHITLPVLDEHGLLKTREVLEVAPTGPRQWQLLHSPAYVDGIAADDVIELDPALPEGFRIVSRGRNLAVVAVLKEPDQCAADPALQLRESLSALGGRFDGGPPRVLVFTVPVSAGFANVERVLSVFLESQPGAAWWYGNVYEHGDVERPLGWWRIP